jgi:hypothetical protein
MFEWLWRLFQESQPSQAPEVAGTARAPISHDFWVHVEGEELAQGDLLPACLVVRFTNNVVVRIDFW